MFKTLKKAWEVKDVRTRILFTLFMVIVVRVGSQIPVPGTDSSVIKEYLANLNKEGAFNIFNSFTGNSLESFSILALSITPYITASIIMELLTVAIPRLEELQRSGNDGRKKIAEYTRYATVVLALIESIAMTIGFGNQGLFSTNNAFYWIVCVIALTAGSAFLMWVGERITEKGIGNGISIVLLVNILSGIPSDFKTLFTSETFTKINNIPLKVVAIAAAIVLILAILTFTVWLNGAIRKIPVQYAGKIVGRRVMGGQSSNIPLKVLTASVIPVIFASSILSIPAMISQFAGGNPGGFWGTVIGILSPSYWFRAGLPWYYSLGVILYILLIFVFAYFYTSITFNPTEVAENLKKQGGFVPGFRPGKPTSEYLNSVLNVIVFIGATGLSIIALIPIVLTGALRIPGSISFLGTSLIIIVGVILETLQQIEGRMVSREYDSIF
ncbi:MAG: preprotein translocase subunit SecY [Lachnospiraceae bacterium]|nr:preprotein translocase subunit SecY [Lachnospiraceae bacterium]